MADMAYPVFVNTDGTALEGGQIYLGATNADPETQPIAAFWDAALSIPAAQPLRTSGGVIVRDGTPAEVFAAQPYYSIRVRNRAGSVVWYKPTAGGTGPSTRLNFPVAGGPPGEQGEQGEQGEGLAEVMAPGGSALVGYDARNTVKGKLDLMVYATDARFAGGAVGDGVADDRPALQAAIDWLASQGGGTLYLPVGTYRMTVQLSADGQGVCCLNYKAGVSIVGENRYASILKVANGQMGPGTYFRGITTNGRAPKVLLSNFTFDGNRDGQGIFRDAGNGGNIVLDCSRLTMMNIDSIEANGNCFQVRGGPTNPVELVTISNCDAIGASGSNINADGSVAAEFNGNGIGFQIAYIKDAIISNCKARGTHDNAFDIYNNSMAYDPVGGGIILNGIQARSCRVGTFFETTARCVISDYYFEDMAEAGIAVNRQESAPSEIDIGQGRIRSTVNGIRISGNAESVSVRGAKISNMQTTNGGCIFLFNAANVLIEGCEFKPNNPNIPLIYTGGPQAVNLQIGPNYYWGTPNTDRMIVLNPATDHFGFNAWGPMIPINNGGMVPAGLGGTMFRNNVRFSTAQINGAFGANGAVPQLAYALPAAATDAASTQALVNELRNLVIANGTGKAS